MNLPPAMWLTFPKEAQRDLIAQLGELLHRHLHAQRGQPAHPAAPVLVGRNTRSDVRR